MSGAIQNCPIFPLQTVLFPGGVLPLRIFEPRYLAMVRESLQEEKPFGVCRITDGQEAGRPADHDPVGCLAHIAEWNMAEQGILKLRTLGTQRFRIVSRRVETGGLIRADITLIAPDPEVPVPDAYEPCVRLLRHLLARIEASGMAESHQIVAAPWRYECAAWIANRLSEFLPIDNQCKQALMEIEDPLERLRQVHALLEDHEAL